MKKAICNVVMTGLLGTVAFAQDATPASEAAKRESASQIQEAPASASTRKISSFNKATSFVGSAVMNDKGEQIGKVQDLVFDLEKGELGYVVMSLDVGGKSRSVPVPIRALKPGEGEKRLVLNMNEAILASAETVSEGEWPSTDVFAIGGPASSEVGAASSAEESSSEPQN